MDFEPFVESAQTIFDSFPNESVWLQGGLKPNRQLHKPEAGYCIVIRYDEKTTRAIANFMTRIRFVLPPVVEYNEQNLHTTVGTYGKGDLESFACDPATLQKLMKAVEEGISCRSHDLCVTFGKWLYNAEAMLVSGYPNQDLWGLFQRIKDACQENGCPLEMGRIVHITTARFISRVSRQECEKFIRLMESAPTIAPAKPGAVDIATWGCDGRAFHLVTHKRYGL